MSHDHHQGFPPILDVTRSSNGGRDWTRRSLLLLETDQRRSADTHLLHFDTPALAGISIYLKDESTHPTGSLKHRLARSLFLLGICNGKIAENTPVVEASSGSTAVSEAYFARLLGLPFHAVMPAATSPEKIAEIERLGGNCHLVGDAHEIYVEATALARQLGGVYLDQFTFAERAADWRGNNNIADSIFQQMSEEPFAVPSWIVMSAGTGGTTATIGRYIRYRHFNTRLCVVDVENSVYFDAYCNRDDSLRSERSSRIEGIGRPRVEPSFLPDVVDRMIRIPDPASLAAMRVLSRRLGRKVGGSTGTNFYGVCWLASQMIAAGEKGSIVTLICDSGERYLNTYYSDQWISGQNIGIAAYEVAIEEFLDSGRGLSG